MALQPWLSFAHCRAASTVVPLLPNATITPSKITSVYPVPALHFFLFSHQHPSSHTVLTNSRHVSKPSQYCLIHYALNFFFYCSSSTHLFIPNSIRVTATKLLKHFSSITFTVLLSALLYFLYASAPCNAVGTSTF